MGFNTLKPSCDLQRYCILVSYLQGYDMVPDPTVIIAAMKACRRLNDYGLAVRYLEAVKVCRKIEDVLLVGRM